MKILKRRWWLAAAAAVLVAVSAVLTTVGSGGANAAPSRATAARAGGLGQLAGLLPRNHLTEESALQVDLSKETVRLPLYPGTANGKTVWYVLLDASDAGLAHDLGVNYAPKLANIAISDPAAVQTVTLGSPTPQANPFGPAAVHFDGYSRFDQFQENLGISSSLLTSRLKRMVGAGLLERRQYQANPARYEYLLTELGRSLRPVLVVLAAWGNARLAPRERSMVLVDAQTGAEAEPVLVDRATGRRVDGPDFVFTAGPAASRPFRDRYAAHPKPRQP